MSIKSDKWIRRMAQDHNMIGPVLFKQGGAVGDRGEYRLELRRTEQLERVRLKGQDDGGAWNDEECDGGDGKGEDVGQVWHPIRVLGGR